MEKTRISSELNSKIVGLTPLYDSLGFSFLVQTSLQATFAVAVSGIEFRPKNDIGVGYSPTTSWNLKTQIRPYFGKPYYYSTSFSANYVDNFVEIKLKFFLLIDINWLEPPRQSAIFAANEPIFKYRLISNIYCAGLLVVALLSKMQMKTDHHVSVSDPSAWKYYEIWESFR